MGNRELKISLINDLKTRGIYTRQVSGTEIQTRCPFCGDSKSNRNTGHLYIRVNPNDNYPIVFNCFKCPAHGVLQYEDLELLGLSQAKYKDSLIYMNKTSAKFDSHSSYFDAPDKYFEYKIPNITYNDKVKYIENRLGYNFTESELSDIRIITSLRDFLLTNDIHKITCKPYIANLLESKYVGFLSNNNSHILFRDITEKEKYPWVKYPITEESYGQKVFYSIRSEVDLYTTDDITINLSEGVLDSLSIAYNLENISENTLNIAVCGKFYSRMITKLFSMGFIGSNIIINIFSDRDYTKDTSIDYYRKIFKYYKHLVKSINIYYNTKYKDCGVPKKDILLKKYNV